MGLLSTSADSTIHKALVIYDFSSGEWQRGPDLPDCRSEFCCSLDPAKGLIYIAGGSNREEVEEEEEEEEEMELCSAAVYNVGEEKWEYLPPMIWREYQCYSVFTDGKLYVLSHREGHIQAYDPNTRQWSAICDCYYDGSMQPSFAAFGRIYHQGDYGEIIEWDYVENQFRVAGTLPPRLYTFIGGVMWNGQILMVGLDAENVTVFYVFKPSEEAGKEEKWTLISTLSATELPDIVPTIGTLALSFFNVIQLKGKERN